MTSEPQLNLALRYHSFGNPRDVLKLESSQLVQRSADALRVRMTCAPINPSDIIPVTGAYRHLTTPPKTAGYEGFGRVVEASPQFAHLLGQRVLPLRGDGTWQRYVDCDPEIAVPVPDSISDSLAARGYINPLSAQFLLQKWPVANKRVIITGAGSNIAALLIQWAQADGAAQITGIYRSPERRDRLETLGVLPVAERDIYSVDAEAREADITFDAVGGPVGSRILNRMRLGTECVGYGLLSGQPVLPDSQNTAAHRRFHLRDELSKLDPEAWQNCFLSIWPRLAAAKLQEIQRIPFEDWQKALDLFEMPGRAHKPMLQF
ncbi:zinc-dependent alcohol dehydrogenase family protein [Phaeobacter inhibens]|nr:zinc-dependent alcohol dehydrogenase family protein [Phaeobacter inhibens]